MDLVDFLIYSILSHVHLLNCERTVMPNLHANLRITREVIYMKRLCKSYTFKKVSYVMSDFQCIQSKNAMSILFSIPIYCRIHRLTKSSC